MACASFVGHASADWHSGKLYQLTTHRQNLTRETAAVR